MSVGQKVLAAGVLFEQVWIARQIFAKLDRESA
jgi:hypothetical protein